VEGVEDNAEGRGDIREHTKKKKERNPNKPKNEEDKLIPNSNRRVHASKIIHREERNGTEMGRTNLLSILKYRGS